MTLNELKQALLEGGVAGAGGAGFPTYAKLTDKAETIILNCAECEPLIKADRQLMIAYVREILTGMQLLVEAMGAKEGILAIKKSYIASIDAVNSCLKEFKTLRLHILPDIYPAGDEVVLVYEITGKIVPQGKIPILVGCVVVNVETVLNVYNKVFEHKNVTKKYVTVAGMVRNPATFEVPIGTSAADLLELAGGCTGEAVLLMGGPMTGRICTTYDVVTKTTKAILALPASCPPIRKRRNTSRMNIRNAMSVCSQCSICTNLCPRNLLGQSIKPHEFMRALANGITSNPQPYLNSFFCCSCGLCELYSCHQDLSPRSLLDAYKSGLREKGVKISEKAGKVKAESLRDERRVPEHRLILRLGLQSFDCPAPLKKAEGGIREVKLKLLQSIGAPCTAVVRKGDCVTEGQKIGEPPEGALGICLHASIEGVVDLVTDEYIVIKAKKGDRSCSTEQ